MKFEDAVEVIGPALIVLLVNAPLDRPAVVGVVVLLGESVAVDFAAAACDFLRCAAGFERWLAPVGFPRRTEHFWKCRLRISLLEKVSLHKTHMYGRSPVSIKSQQVVHVEPREHLRLSMWRFKCLACRYVLLQFGQGNLPSASFAGTALLVFGEPLTALGITAALPGALGNIPLRPCEPTTCVLVGSLPFSVGSPCCWCAFWSHI